MQNNFNRVLALVNCCMSLAYMCVSTYFKQHVFTPLYRGVKDTLKLSAHQKESFEAWSNHQWSFAWFSYCPMKDQFQIHSKSGGTLV